MSFIYRRGEGAKRRVMHLARFSPLGTYVGVLCGTSTPLNTSCNLPLGRPTCKRCQREHERIIEAEQRP